MRIIAKQSDYYDHIQSYGMDPGVVYPRVISHIGYKQLSKEMRKDLCDVEMTMYSTGNYNSRTPLYKVNILIAGQHYRIYYRPKKGVELPDSVNKFTFGQAFDVFDNYHDAKEGLKSTSFFNGNEPDYFDQGNLKYYDYAKSVKSPVIVGGIDIDYNWKDSDRPGENTGNVRNVVMNVQSGLFLNAPVLQFMGINHIKEFDPHTIFMKISTFVSGINTTDMVELNDKSKIVKSGFDIKQSFRYRK